MKQCSGAEVFLKLQLLRHVVVFMYISLGKHTQTSCRALFRCNPSKEKKKSEVRAGQSFLCALQALIYKYVFIWH